MNTEQLLKSSEGRSLEFKRELPPRLDKVLQTVIAFANGSGGDVIIGMDDKREVLGIDQDPLEVEERLASAIHDSITPLPGVYFQTIACQGKILFRIKVLPGPNKPYYLRAKGPEAGSYVRVGATNRLADRWLLDDLRRQGHNRGFDEELETGFACEALSMQVLSRYLGWRHQDLVPSLDYLVKEKLAVRFNGTCHPTVGGLLLFCDLLPEPYEYAGFNVVLYGSGDRAELRHSQAVTCSLLDMPEMIMDRLAAYLGSRVEIESLRREQDLEIPSLALREAVVNAICHRDYAMRGASSKVEIFSDRVEIISPGTLPVGISLVDFGLGTSEIRNRQIVKMFRKAGYIEQLGTGIMRMRQACRQAGLPAPEFQEVGNFLKVVFPRRQMSLPEELKSLYDLLNVEGELASSQIADRLGIHQNTALNRLKKLQDLRLVRKKGRGSEVTYASASHP
ncbi:MAG: ATP-binding protein [Desulfurivibrio sp.]|nr:ATP-binding protein [Desulfurivibrio sp.]